MNIDEITKQNLLYDCYGQLLTKRQREVYALYTQENYSLSEIAEELGISRQGVHDALKNGQKQLTAYEEKLGLVQRLLSTEDRIRRVDDGISRVIAALQQGDASPQACIDTLQQVRSIIDQLED